MDNTLFMLLGFVVGAIGTLIGAGGGFLLSPVFIFLYPDLAPATLTAMSLLAVSANSTSGSIGYAIRKKVHWPSVLLYTTVGIPGVMIGVKLSAIIPRHQFELLFGIFMIALSAFVLYRSFKKRDEGTLKIFWTKSTMILGSFLSFFIGILSSLLGIGGGIIHVPLLSEGLKYPLHLAAGTSHAILAFTSIVAVIAHFHAGDYHPFNPMLPFLCIGLVMGAQLGASYSKKTPQKIILRVLGFALISVGFRLVAKSLF